MISRSKILIVDDILSARKMLKDLLASQGFQLLFAHNGATALETAVSATPDLILLDVMMPNMDGFEVCQQLRNTPITAEIPVIMITALNDQKSRLKGIAAGADDFLTKPFDLHELRLRVKTITRLNRYRRLLMERKKFEYVITHARTGHLILDSQGQIVFANLQAQRYLNSSIDETTPPTARDFRTIASQTFRPEPTAAWENWPAPLPQNMSRYLVRPETKWLKAQWLKVAVLSYESETVINWLVTIEDVTCQIEEVYSMRNFHNAVSHKFRTSLSGLIGGLEIISQWGENLSLAELTKLFELTHKSAQRLTGQIEDVLRYTQIPVLAQESNHFFLRQLPELVMRIAQDVGLNSVHIKQPEAAQTWGVTVSQRLLEMVFYELLENAYKFHPHKTPVVQIDVKREGDFVVFTVSDNGRTLSLEQMARVWTPYYQIEKTFTGEIPGMGLGLSTVASLVWQANGHCQMVNRAQQPGVTVEIKLPMLSAKNELPPFAAELWQPTQTRTTAIA